LRTIRLTFSTAVDPATFQRSAVILQGPNGRITAFQVVNVAPGANGNRVWDIRLNTPQLTPGQYTLSLIPSIRSRAGRALNQNNNALDGESAADRFTLRLNVFAPIILVGS
jgi:hypothetical protein